MRVAVVGAAGFVGGHILRVFRERGIPARSVVRSRHASAADPDQRIADALDVYALRDAFEGCDLVVHAALGDDDVILGSLAPVYAAAEAVGARRLVYISTGSVHGQAPAPGTDESSPLHVRHALSYNNAKVRAERRLRRLRARGTVELVMLRPTIVVGPGSRWVFDFGYGLRDHTAFVVDGARGICNSIYVDNLAHAVWLALNAPGVDGESLIVNDAEIVTWADLYRAIAEGLGFDFARVASYSPPIATATLRQRYLDPIRRSDWTRAIVAQIPRGAKNTANAIVRRVRGVARRGQSSPTETGPAAPNSSGPVIAPEVAALQRCRWRLPHDKAVRLLGYAPPISFAEGCRRSVEWMKAQMVAP